MATGSRVVRAPVIEVFASIQGEGRFVGRPMTFLRLATCPIRCRYCDTPNSYTASAEFAVEVGGAWRSERNPVTAERAAVLVDEVTRGSRWGGARGGAGSGQDRADVHPAVSVTGGEPLVHAEFVRALGEELDARLHLETAALDVDALRVALPALAHVSADFKLPETLADGADHSAAHLRCIEATVDAGRSCDVKIVLTNDVSDAAVARALDHLRPFRESVLLYLQPVTPFGAVQERLELSRLAGAHRRAGDLGFDVRVLPQIHPALGVD